jgi:hypothetical protein
MPLAQGKFTAQPRNRATVRRDLLPTRSLIFFLLTGRISTFTLNFQWILGKASCRSPLESRSCVRISPDFLPPDKPSTARVLLATYQFQRAILTRRLQQMDFNLKLMARERCNETI